MKELRLGALGLLVLLVSAHARAQEGPHTMSVTVSGGASLGSYEAGYLYVLEETFERNPELLRLRIVTGASAGSTNALLLALAGCLPSVPRPEDSPLYTTWLRSSFERLFLPEHVGPLGMFSRSVLNEVWDEQEAVFERGLPETCDFVIGVPATRLEAFEIPIRGALGGLARSEETFMVRVRGRGPGRAPSVENYVDRARAYAPALLPVDGDVPHEMRAVRDAVFGSSAFPFVFSPYPIPHCIGEERSQNQNACVPHVATYALFADGGVLDNTPLRLAATIARTGLVPDREGESTSVFREAPDITERALPTKLLFLHLDPTMAAYPFEPPPPEETRADSGAIETNLRLLLNAVAGGRARQLSGLLEEYPEIRQRVRVSHAYVPQTGDLLYGFFGLFDEQFLTFDFVLGMVDAQRMIETELTAALRASTGRPELELAERVPDRTSAINQSAACVAAFLHGDGDPDALCRGEALASTRVLLQLAIERLYLRCATLAPGAQTEHAHCRRAMTGEAPPRVPHLAEDRDRRGYRRGAGEAAVEHAVRRLRALGFHFRGLGLDADEGSRALLTMRRRLAEMGGAFVDAQPNGRQLLDMALRYVMNEIVYTPPRAVGHVVAGRHVEVGASFGGPFSHARWLRGTAALSIVGFETLIASGPTRMSFGLAAGVELEPIPLSRAAFQLRLGARLGYALGTVDGAGREACGEDEDVSRYCSRAYVDAYVAFSLAETLRLQLSAYLYPGHGDDLAFAWFVGPSIGVQLRSRE